jgi:hypothetical protein
MKKSFVTALAVALLGAMTLGCGRLVGIGFAQARQEQRPDGRRRRFVQDARLARQEGRPYRRATMTTLTLPHPPAVERLRGRRHPVRRVVSLVPVSPILRQTGTERPRGAALPASLEPGLTKGDR